jgi:6-phosphogluconate dehydrogenase
VAIDGWRREVATATHLGIPIPASLGVVYDALPERLPAALTQGLRDFFGAHTTGSTTRPEVSSASSRRWCYR